MKKKVHLLFFVMISSMVFALTGCGGRRNVADTLADMEETGTGSGENGNEGQEAGASGAAALEVPDERWKETIASEGEHSVEVSISAKPETPENGTMKIVELVPVSFDAEGRKMMMNQLCDADSIRVLDDNKLPKWYLEGELAEYEKDISGSAGEGGGTLDPAVTEILQRDKAQLDSAPKEGAVPTDYEEERYTGTIDGITYLFSCRGNDMFSFSAPFLKDKIALLEKAELTEDCHLEQTYDLPPQNECSMSQEEAELKAAGYLSDWGYSEFTLWKVRPLSFHASNTKSGDVSWSEGYEMTFVRAVDGVLVNGDPYADSRVERINLALTDKGIFSGSFVNLYQTSEVIAENPRLLGFEEVKQAFASAIAEHAGELEAAGSISLDKMELTYFPVADHEDAYTLLPVWKLYKKNVMDEIENVFIINAIDGSYIQ